MLACPQCSRDLDHETLFCGTCRYQYQREVDLWGNEVPVLFRPGSDYDYLIDLNYDDIRGHLGKDVYEEKGYAKSLVTSVDPKPGERILDLGAGHGHVSEWLLEAGARVVSTDILFPTLKVGRNKEKYLCSADALPFRTASFDKVVFTDVQEHIPPGIEEAVVREIYRVLRPGGVVYVEFPGSIIPMYTGLLVLNTLIRIKNRFSDKKIPTFASPREPAAHVNVRTPMHFNRLYRRAGFKGRMTPRTVKFFSLKSERLRRLFTAVVNIFPLNYCLSTNISGQLVKPG